MMGALRAYPFFAASSRNVGTTTVLFCASGLFCAAELRHTDSAARPEKSNRITVRIFIESPQGNDSALDQYCSLKNVNAFCDAETLAWHLVSRPQRVVAHLALHAPRIPSFATGDHAFFEYFVKNRVV